MIVPEEKATYLFENVQIPVEDIQIERVENGALLKNMTTDEIFLKRRILWIEFIMLKWKICEELNDTDLTQMIREIGELDNNFIVKRDVTCTDIYEAECKILDAKDKLDEAKGKQCVKQLQLKSQFNEEDHNPNTICSLDLLTDENISIPNPNEIVEMSEEDYQSLRKTLKTKAIWVEYVNLKLALSEIQEDNDVYRTSQEIREFEKALKTHEKIAEQDFNTVKLQFSAAEAAFNEKRLLYNNENQLDVPPPKRRRTFFEPTSIFDHIRTRVYKMNERHNMLLKSIKIVSKDNPINEIDEAITTEEEEVMDNVASMFNNYNRI